MTQPGAQPLPGEPGYNPGRALAPNPDVVNEFHRYADTDNDTSSLHHTLGIDPNAASPGDHTHDGKTSKLLTTHTHSGTETTHSHQGIVGTDSRAVADTPAGLRAINLRDIGVDYPARLAPEFKAGGTIGLPSSYYGVETIIPWGDDSGGGMHQMAFGSGGVNDVYIRYGSSSGGWGAWQLVGGEDLCGKTLAYYLDPGDYSGITGVQYSGILSWAAVAGRRYRVDAKAIMQSVVRTGGSDGSVLAGVSIDGTSTAIFTDETPAYGNTIFAEITAGVTSKYAGLSGPTYYKCTTSGIAKVYIYTNCFGASIRVYGLSMWVTDCGTY